MKHSLIFSTLFLTCTALAGLSASAYAASDPLKAAIHDAKNAYTEAVDAKSPDAAKLRQLWQDLSSGKITLAQYKALSAAPTVVTAEDVHLAKKKWMIAKLNNSPDADTLKATWQKLSAALAAAGPATPPKAPPVVEVPFDLAKQVLSLGRPTVLKTATGEKCEAIPPLGRTFYIDPAKGKTSNDGSAEHPFRTLSEVAANTKLAASLQAGDRFILAEGDHGYVRFNSAFKAPGYVTFIAAGGAHPVVRGMTIEATGRFVFQGIDFTKLNRLKDNNWLVLTYPSAHNIVFKMNRFYTKEDMGGVSDRDWLTTTYNGVFSRSSCTTFAANEFMNLNNALRLGGVKTLAMGNLFHDQMNDNILLTSSDLTVRNNVILDGRNNIENAKVQHSDGMQGWAEPSDATMRNVTIDGNFVVNFLPFKTQPIPNKSGQVGEVELNNVGAYRQGISIFDGKWDGLTVTNNVIVTNANGGMVFRGPSNALIANNTVLSSDPEHYVTELAIRQAKDRSPFKNVVLANNLVNKLTTTSGVTAVGNVTTAAPYTDSLRKVDIASKTYDVRLKADSKALLAGKAEYAATLDITGKPRRIVDGKTDAGALTN